MKAEYSVSVSRLIHAPRVHVFEAFSSASALSQWFSPSADISLDVEVFEFAVNGSFRLRYFMPDGTQPIVGGVYELITPPHQIVFSWLWEQPDPHADIPTRVDVRFSCHAQLRLALNENTDLSGYRRSQADKVLENKGKSGHRSKIGQKVSVAYIRHFEWHCATLIGTTHNQETAGNCEIRDLSCGEHANLVACLVPTSEKRNIAINS